MESIQVSSDIVEFIKAETKGGLRFGFVGGKYIIPPNQEGLLGIRSIHSYDSLSSKNYQRLVRRLGERGAVTYGRHFLTITDDRKLGDDAFSYTGIGLFVSRYAFAALNIEMIGRGAGYFFYRRTPRPVLEAQVADFTLNEGKRALIMGSLDEAAGSPVERLEDLDDFTLFKVTPADRETLLFVSRQYHPHWRARSRAGLLDTVMINDFYRGVVVPPDTEMIILEFRPYSLRMWIPQVLFVLLALALLASRVFLKGDRL